MKRSLFTLIFLSAIQTQATEVGFVARTPLLANTQLKLTLSYQSTVKRPGCWVTTIDNDFGKIFQKTDQFVGNTTLEIPARIQQCESVLKSILIDGRDLVRIRLPVDTIGGSEQMTAVCKRVKQYVPSGALKDQTLCQFPANSVYNPNLYRVIVDLN